MYVCMYVCMSIASLVGSAWRWFEVNKQVAVKKSVVVVDLGARVLE